MLKLNDLLNTKKVISIGFPAIAGLGEYSKGTEEVVLSSLSPAILAEQGVTEYYALQLPRGTVFKTTEDIINANPTVRKYIIEVVDKLDYLPYANPIDTVIVSRHKGTVGILQHSDLWSGSKVFESVTEEDIKGKHVVGTLPPHLITACDMYTSVVIKDFDYNKDGDLSGKELKDRLVIAKKPIRVKEVEEEVLLDMENKVIKLNESVVDKILMEGEPLEFKCPKTGCNISFWVAPSGQEKEHFTEKGIVFDAQILLYNKNRSAYIKLYTYWEAYKKLIRNKGLMEKYIKQGKIRYHEDSIYNESKWSIKLI